MLNFKKFHWILPVLFLTANAFAGPINGEWQLVSPSSEGLVDQTLSITGTNAFLDYTYSELTVDGDTASFNERWVISYDRPEDLDTEASISMVSLRSDHRLYRNLRITSGENRVRFLLSSDSQCLVMQHLDGDFQYTVKVYRRVMPIDRAITPGVSERFLRKMIKDFQDRERARAGALIPWTPPRSFR